MLAMAENRRNRSLGARIADAYGDLMEVRQRKVAKKQIFAVCSPFPKIVGNAHGGSKESAKNETSRCTRARRKEAQKPPKMLLETSVSRQKCNLAPCSRWQEIYGFWHSAHESQMPMGSISNYDQGFCPKTNRRGLLAVSENRRTRVRRVERVCQK